RTKCEIARVFRFRPSSFVRRNFVLRSLPHRAQSTRGLCSLAPSSFLYIALAALAARRYYPAPTNFPGLTSFPFLCGEYAMRRIAGALIALLLPVLAGCAQNPFAKSSSSEAPAAA